MSQMRRDVRGGNIETKYRVFIVTRNGLKDMGVTLGKWNAISLVNDLKRQGCSAYMIRKCWLKDYKEK